MTETELASHLVKVPKCSNKCGFCALQRSHLGNQGAARFGVHAVTRHAIVETVRVAGVMINRTKMLPTCLIHPPVSRTAGFERPDRGSRALGLPPPMKQGRYTVSLFAGRAVVEYKAKRADRAMPCSTYGARAESLEWKAEWPKVTTHALPPKGPQKL